MGEGKALPGGTDPRRIQLGVESVAPDLSGIDKAIAKIYELNKQLIGANTLAGTLNNKLGLSFAGLGASAEQAAVRTSKAMGKTTESVKLAATQISDSNKQLISQTKQYKSLTEYQAGRESSTRTVKRSGLGVKQTLIDYPGGAKFISEEWKPGDTEKWWNKAINLGYKQLQRDLKAQRKWREHDVLWAKRRAEEAQKLSQNQENLGAAARRGSLGGATSRTSIEQQAALAAEDFKLNATSQERYQLAQRLRRRHNRLWAQRHAQATSAGIQQQIENANDVLRSNLAGVPRVTSTSGAYGTRMEIIAKQREYIETLGRINQAAEITAKEQRTIARLIRKAEAKIIEQETAVGVNGGHPAKHWWDRFKGGAGRFINRGLSGLTPVGFSKNFLTVTSWTAAVGSLYAIIGGVEHAYERMKELNLESAKLQQIFQGVGGTSEQLTDDVLKLAAAEGRSTDEAMQAAIQWSRLGLTRKQVADATRVSLMAANVAETSAANATESLTAIMQGFNMQVSQLGPALGILNRESNTYRVTVNELLKGMENMSSFAQQAGISLARLSAIITVSVQKTGQSGEQLSNALKTSLARMNRGEVQDYFLKTFGVNIAGTSGGLQKVWETYSKANAEQQRTILLHVAGARQGNRFRAILETYSESAFAAADALRHLNSAEQENAKITNTVIASANRLSSSWDRMINSAGKGGLSGYIRGGLDTLAGVVGGLTPASNSRPGRPRFYSPGKASVLGSIYGIANTVTLGLGGELGALNLGASHAMYGGSFKKGVSDYWKNYWTGMGYFNNPATARQQDQVMLQKEQQVRAKGQADSTIASILYREARIWNYLNPESRKRELSILKRRVSPEAYQGLIHGNTSGIITQANAAAKSARHNLEIADKEAVALAKSAHLHVSRLEREQKLAKTEEDRASLNKKIADAKREAAKWDAEANQTQSSYQKSERETLNSYQDRMNAMEGMKGLIKGASTMFGAVGMPKSIGNASMLQMQLDLINQYSKTHALDSKVQDWFDTEQATLAARIKLQKSPQGIFQRVWTQNAGVESRLAEEEANAHAIGLSKGEQLLNQRAYLEREIQQYESQSSHTQAESIRYLSQINDLKNTELELSARSLQNEKERRQVLLDARHQFEKSLISTGPSQLLGKLAAFQISRHGIKNAGELFSLSPGLRKDVYDLAGGDQMAKLNAERSVLRGHVLGGPALERSFARLDEHASKAASVLSDAASKISAHLGSAAHSALAIDQAISHAASRMAGRSAAHHSAPHASTPPQMLSPWRTIKPAATEQEWDRVNGFHGSV